MSDKRRVSVTTVSPTFLLFLLFLGLKLMGFIDWSWVWVTAPLWVPLAVVVGLMVLVALGFGIVLATAAVWDLVDNLQFNRREKKRNQN